MQHSPTSLFEEAGSTTVRGSPFSSNNDSGGEESGAKTQPDGLDGKNKAFLMSCELCKARKVKCDRGEPACGRCIRIDGTCIYRQKKKPGLRAGYGQELERKINRLEAMLKVLGHRVEDHILHDHEESNRQQVGTREGQLPPLRTSPSTINGVQYSEEAISLDEREQFPRAFDTISVQTILSVPEREGYSEPETHGSNVLDYRGERRMGSDLPPYDLVYSLVDLYFKHVNTWSPILDRQVTVDTLFAPCGPEEPDCILLHAIIVTSLRFSTDTRLTPELRSQYHKVSKEKVQLYALQNLNKRSIQALLILALDVLGSFDDAQGWNLLSLLSRNILQLGLGVGKGISSESFGSLQAFTMPRPGSWIEEEEERRLVWMVYVLDRYATVATTCDFGLNEKELNRPLPCRYDLFSKNEPVETRSFRWPERSETIVDQPENLGSFSYHCEVLRILSQIHRFLQQPIDVGSRSDVEQWQSSCHQLDRELKAWLCNLPESYDNISQRCHSDPSSKISNWIVLHAAIVTTVIRLHSPAAYPTVHSNIFTASDTAVQRCLAAMQSLRQIAQDAVETNMLSLLGPAFAFSLWVSARLLLVHASTTDGEPDPNITFFITVLEQMGQYWGVAKGHAELLSRLMQEYQESKRNNRFSNVFANMRRQAYRLSVEISQYSRLNPNSNRNRTTTSNELDYFAAFDFFNYPRSRQGSIK